MAEIRNDIITGNLVIISPERAKRPEDFKSNDSNAPSDKTYTENCPFCKGNESQTPPELLKYYADSNHQDWEIRSVPNLFAPLHKDASLEVTKQGMYEKITAAGSSEVFIETPEHNKTLGAHSIDHITKLIQGLKERFEELKKDERIEYIQVFKNFGAVAGASKEHAHWQIWAIPVIPQMVSAEMQGAKRYYEEHNSCPYCDMISNETHELSRVVFENDKFIAFCPYASRFAFETWILPKNHHSSFDTICEKGISDLAKTLKHVISNLEDKLKYPPYNIVLRTLPIRMGEQVYFHWHIEILPRLTTFAGFEWGSGMIVNPTPPEVAAQSLK